MEDEGVETIKLNRNNVNLKPLQTTENEQSDGLIFEDDEDVSTSQSKQQNTFSVTSKQVRDKILVIKNFKHQFSDELKIFECDYNQLKTKSPEELQELINEMDQHLDVFSNEKENLALLDIGLLSVENITRGLSLRSEGLAALVSQDKSFVSDYKRTLIKYKQKSTPAEVKLGFSLIRAVLVLDEVNRAKEALLRQQSQQVKPPLPPSQTKVENVQSKPNIEKKEEDEEAEDDSLDEEFKDI